MVLEKENTSIIGKMVVDRYDIPNKYLLYKVYIGLISKRPPSQGYIKGTQHFV